MFNLNPSPGILINMQEAGLLTFQQSKRLPDNLSDCVFA